MKHLLPGLLLFAACLSGPAGCDVDLLSFGEDIHKTEADIGPQELARIEAVTSQKLPPDTRGILYNYLGSGIDDGLNAKLRIDASQQPAAEAIVQQLTQNDDPFKTPFVEELDLSHLQPDDVLISRKGEWSPHNYGSAFLTREDGVLYLYVIWYTL